MPVLLFQVKLREYNNLNSVRFIMNKEYQQQTYTSIFRFRLLNSLQSPAYRLYFLGSLGQFAAMNMQMVNNPLLLYRLTGSATLLGLMSLIGSFPLIIMSFWGGAIADRVSKKIIMVMGSIACGFINLGIALALEIGFLSREVPGSYWILIGAFCIQGAIFGLMMPALQAIITEIVNKENLMNAIALSNLEMNALSLVTPGLAGLIIDTFDFQAVYYLITGFYLYQTIFFMFIPAGKRSSLQRGKIIEDIARGIGYIRENRLIFFILIFTLAMVVLTMPYQQLLPIYADDILKVGATGMGIMMSMTGAGALGCSLILAAVPAKRRGLLLLIGGLIAGSALLGFAFSSCWYASLSLLVLIGLSQTMRNTIGTALLQSYTEAQFMGRVMSMQNVQFGVMSLFTFFVGVLADIFPVQWVVGSLALGLLVISLVAFSIASRIRSLN